MTPLDFLRRILPPTGLYCAARLVNTRFTNTPCATLEELAQQVLAYDAQGVAAYHANASFRDAAVPRTDGKPGTQFRVQRNVQSIRSLWMDLDCGEGKPYATQEDGIDALAAFLAQTGLPAPLACSSGFGIHLYFVLTRSIGPDAWKGAAEALKTLAAAHGFAIDAQCSGDSARVLRTVGTWNRKNPADPRPVELIADAPDIDYGEFNRLLLAALAAQGVKAPEIKTRDTAQERLNEAFSISQSFPPCSAVKVADRCQQLAKMRDTRGDILEGHWYAGIQLLCHSVEGDDLTHRWSDGYAGYSREETDRKIAQIRGQNIGPTLCKTFESRNPGGCDNCPFKDKISSPAQLGVDIKSAASPVIQVAIDPELPDTEVALPPPPRPFTRRAEGGIYVEEDGIEHKVYGRDIFPFDIVHDDHLGYEVVKVKHATKNNGWREFSLPTHMLAKETDFHAELLKRGIQPLSKKRMLSYMHDYIAELREAIKIKQLFKSMGWKNDATEFVLGDRLYRKGEMITAGTSAGARTALVHFISKGDIKVWRTLTSIFDTPGLEPHAFLLLVAFAAPLVELTGRNGFTVSAVGTTGIGKSTMGRFMASIYGNSEHTWLGKGASTKAVIVRLGAHNSIPVYMDEITTIESEPLRELVYMIPTGIGRETLTRDRQTRAAETWNTILIGTSNASLCDKLRLEKHNPEAEIARLFEIDFPTNQDFLSVVGDIHKVLPENFGVAGHKYVRHLVENREAIKAEADVIIAEMQQFLGLRAEDRFWIWAAALALCGGRIARRLEIIDFDPDRILPWLRSETKRMRAGVDDNRLSPDEVLSRYLAETVSERLVVTKLNDQFAGTFQRPRELTQHYEKDSETLWISKDKINNWIKALGYDAHLVGKDLLARDIVLSLNCWKTLGAGTNMTTGGQTKCWRINMKRVESKTHQELA